MQSIPLKSLSARLGKPIATAATDPEGFFSTLAALPNPDPILRSIGRAEQVYRSIMSDPHVIGDIRSIRGEFRSHDFRPVVGNADDPRSVAAFELCEAYLQTVQPNTVAPDWLEVMWQMNTATLTGYRVHEPVWHIYPGEHKLMKGKILPEVVLDRPGRRYRFDVDGLPLLLSKGNWQGEAIEAYQAIVCRHMATTENPYGQALLSSCFWPWTFKTGGWRFFVKYCERHGLPWPVARYSPGTQDGDIDKMEMALRDMLESAYAVLPQGTQIELLVPSSSGSNLPQENLIDRCNREMSKALTGQAMTAELQQVGSRAAGEVAAARQSSINDADRDIAADGMGQLFRWITLFNFGPDVAPPKLEFFKQENAGKDRAETYDLVRKMGARPSRKAMLDELGIAEAEDNADALLPDAKAAPSPLPGLPAPVGRLDKAALAAAAARGKAKSADDADPKIDFSAMEGFTFARAAGMTEEEAIELAAQAYDDEVEAKVIGPIYQMLVQYERDGKSLIEFRDHLADLVGDIDDEGMREILDRAITYGAMRGAATNAA